MQTIFSAEQLETLRNEYAKIERVDPTQPTFAMITATLDAMTDEQLIQVRDAGIKWLSSLAINRCIRRGL